MQLAAGQGINALLKRHPVRCLESPTKSILNDLEYRRTGLTEYAYFREHATDP